MVSITGGELRSRKGSMEDWTDDADTRRGGVTKLKLGLGRCAARGDTLSVMPGLGLPA